MPYDDEQLDRVLARTGGKCHLCRKRLSRSNYGKVGRRGAWEIDHSKPRARGGSDHGNNLFAACITCNRSKGAQSSRTARARRGFSRAPLSERERAAAIRENAVVLGLGGVIIGALLWGASGGLWLGIAGALVGAQSDPEE